MKLLGGDPKAYVAWAEGYYERKVLLGPVAYVLSAQPLSAALLEQLECERSLDELAADLDEIAYGR
ncbi:MAG: hypothetical protein JNK82_13205 [Myxococcaceae bacterium]|nr:hypothetical protein [Myxococcaceae bacterium]